MVVFFGGIELYLRKYSDTRKPLLILQNHALYSPILSGQAKAIPWQEIESISVKKDSNNTPILELKLSEAAGRIDKAQFWNSTNPCRPTILLSPFAPETQERLIDAISLRLQGGNAQAQGSAAAIHNPLVEERKFQEQLEGLTKYTWCVYAIIGINVLIWLATLLWGASISNTPSDKLLLWGGNAASEVQRGEWWRMLSATFLHASLMHVAMNMIVLYSFGTMVERLYGHRLFVLIYLGSALTGSALSLHYSAQHAVSVGASGAVFGIIGAMLVATYQHKDFIPADMRKRLLGNLLFYIPYALFQGFTTAGIDNAAHIGGLIAGSAIAFILPERLNKEDFEQHWKQRAVIALAVTMTAVFALMVLAPNAQIDMRKITTSGQTLKQTGDMLTAALTQIAEDQSLVKAGKMTEQEADERTRTVHAPVFKKIYENYASVQLMPGDRREALLKDLTRLSQLLTESLAMETVTDSDGKLQPAQPERAAQIDKEMTEIGARIKTQTAELKKP
jgi:rhomboid protease GluP